MAYDCKRKTLRRIKNDIQTKIPSKKVEILVTIYRFIYSVIVYNERNAAAFDSTFGKNAVYCIAKTNIFVIAVHRSKTMQVEINQISRPR